MVIVFFAFATFATAAPKFPPLTGRVVDNAHILSADTAQKLDSKLAQLEATTVCGEALVDLLCQLSRRSKNEYARFLGDNRPH